MQTKEYFHDGSKVRRGIPIVCCLIPSRDHSEDHSLIPDPKRTLQRVLINCFIEALALRCLLSISSEGIPVVLSLPY